MPLNNAEIYYFALQSHKVLKARQRPSDSASVAHITPPPLP